MKRLIMQSTQMEMGQENRHVFPKNASRHGRYQRQRKRFWHFNSCPLSSILSLTTIFLTEFERRNLKTWKIQAVQKRVLRGLPEVWNFS